MRNFIVALLMLALFINCKPGSKQDAPAANSPSVAQELPANPLLNNDWIQEMVLDQGAKWAANIETTEGVAQMNQLLQKTATSSLTDYKNLGNGLNDIKNYIVKECTMTGPSHDNLHVFLHPLIEKIELLQQSPTVEEGAAIKENIVAHLAEYPAYFN